MIVAQFTDGLVRYAQLVDYQGLPYIEALGNFQTPIDMNPSRWMRTNIRYEITEMVETIKSKVDFPDRQAVAVVEGKWFPHLFQKVDSELPLEDREKFLDWQFRETYDLAPDSAHIVHQRLSGHFIGSQLNYFSIAIPEEFRQAFSVGFDKAGLTLTRIELDAFAAADMLSYAGNMRHLERILLIGCEAVEYHMNLIEKGEIVGIADFTIGHNSEIGIDVLRGDWSDIDRIIIFLQTLLKGNPRRTSPVDHTYIYGRPLELDRWERLLKGPEVSLFNPAQAFHLREPKVRNSSQYTELLGTTSNLIRMRFNED
ncbi:MAG: hypothetical protein AUJ47_00095 [Candidatus Marinimicrobia bacterium CG1_02_48_14]|nr:MAG: hypothetical protein AUJ47_00095 [Candidatus Marinimicrobia bacterium CG1_02_48_14]PIZ66413.1 MAG: hypothetical protein COY19_06775 [Candidatus Marinimicrobia bacterium CG_4_10_14_0_2_um_filter_48_9]